MSGASIAAEVAAALAEVGAATGTGPLIGVIRRKGNKTGPDYAPFYEPDKKYQFTVSLGSFSAKEREGTGIEATDIKITASTGAVVPAISDRIEVNGVVYDIHGVTPINPGGMDLMYRIWARK